MNNQLLIPSRIRVGYVKRNDTYTNKLAYVIYYDTKGKIRKEDSWNTWRDHSLPVEEFDNKPHSGFTLNKGVLRDGYWGNGHNMVRVYDDRGIEFEITVGNLLFILMTTDCMKRGLEGEFVYSWAGKELVLLPTGCEEYKKSTQFTSIQTDKVSAKTLIPGLIFQTKRQVDLLYLGKFDWYQIDGGKPIHYDYNQRNESNSRYTPHTIKCDKRYIFLNQKTKEYVTMTSLTNLSSQVTDSPDPKLSNHIEEFSNFKWAKKPVGYNLKPGKLEGKDGWGSCLYYKKSTEGYFGIINTLQKTGWESQGPGQPNKTVVKGYEISRQGSLTFVNGSPVFQDRTSEFDQRESSQQTLKDILSADFWNTQNKNRTYSIEEIEKIEAYHLSVVFEDGSELPAMKYMFGYRNY